MTKRTPGWKLPGKYAKSPGAVRAQQSYRRMVAFYATNFIECPECGAQPGTPCAGGNWYRCCYKRWMIAKDKYGDRKIPKGRKAAWDDQSITQHSLWDIPCVRCDRVTKHRKMNTAFPLCPRCLRKLYRPNKSVDWQLRTLRAELKPEWRISREADGYFLIERRSEPNGRQWLDDSVLEGPASLDTVARAVLRWNWDIPRAEAILRLMEKLPWATKAQLAQIAYRERLLGPSWQYPYK